MDNGLLRNFNTDVTAMTKLPKMSMDHPWQNVLGCVQCGFLQWFQWYFTLKIESMFHWLLWSIGGTRALDYHTWNFMLKLGLWNQEMWQYINDSINVLPLNFFCSVMLVARSAKITTATATATAHFFQLMSSQESGRKRERERANARQFM